MSKTIAALLLLALLVPTFAQPASPNPALDAAVQAIELMNRNLGRWFVIVIVALVLFALVAAWRIWGYSRRLLELGELRSSTERRLGELTDELLRLRTKLVSIGDHVDRTEKDIALLRPEAAADLAAQLSGLEEAIAGLTARLDTELGEVRRQLTELEARIAALTAAEPPKLEVPIEVMTATAAAEAAQAAATQAAQQAEAAATESRETAAQALAAVQRLEEEFSKQLTELRLQLAAVQPLPTEPAVDESRQPADTVSVPPEPVATAPAETDDEAATGDEHFGAGEYGEAVDCYSRWIEKNEANPDRNRLLAVLHNRAVGYLRLGRYLDALNDAAAIEPLVDVSPKAAGAARMLTGVVHLYQGLVDEALSDFEQALVVDPSARKTLAKDEDIAAWIEQNPAEARVLQRGLDRLLGREKPTRADPTAERPKVKSQKAKTRPGKQRRR